MNKKLLTLILLLVIGTVNAQNVKLNSESISSKYLKGNSWTDWSQWENFRFPIVLNEKTITIYTKPKDVYDVVSSANPRKEDGTTIYTFKCLDKEGEECTIELYVYPGNRKSQLYIRWINGIVAINLTV